MDEDLTESVGAPSQDVIAGCLGGKHFLFSAPADFPWIVVTVNGWRITVERPKEGDSHGGV